MKSISKILLLSAVGLYVESGNLSYASFEETSLHLKSGIPTLHTHHTYLRHTQEILNLSSHLFDKRTDKGVKIASVCFITDAGNCSGNDFGNSETPNNDTSEPPEYKTPEEACLEAGYGQTPCPEGSSPIPCPVAPNYFACSCADKFNQECKAPYYGVGESCGGKYEKCEEDLDRACKEENGNYVTSCPSGWQMSDTKCSFDPSYGLCCNLCNGYTYNDEKDIPEGYVKGETCVNCDNEPWFKLAPNPCDGFYDCSLTAPEIGANSCLSGTVTKYDNCKPCPNLGIYATCPTGYKCEYERCSGKYYKVDGCQDGFDWNAAAKTCTCDNKGTYSSCPTGYKCEKEKCSGKYYKVDGCASGYDWNASSKTCTEHCYYEANLDSCPANGNCWYESCSGKYSLSSCKTSYVREGDTCVCPNLGTYSSCPNYSVCKKEACSGKYYITDCEGRYELDSQKQQCTCEPLPLPEQGTPEQHTCWYGLYQESDGCGNKRTVCSSSNPYQNTANIKALEYGRKENATCVKRSYTDGSTKYLLSYQGEKIYCFLCPEYPADYYSSFSTDKNDSFNTMEECEAFIDTQSNAGYVRHRSGYVGDCTREKCWKREASQSPEPIPDFASMTYLNTIEYTNQNNTIESRIKEMNQQLEERTQYKPY